LADRADGPLGPRSQHNTVGGVCNFAATRSRLRLAVLAHGGEACAAAETMAPAAPSALDSSPEIECVEAMAPLAFGIKVTVLLSIRN
jgi:hypothetical protein